jgi:hypothetical protein
MPGKRKLLSRPEFYQESKVLSEAFPGLRFSGGPRTAERNAEVRGNPKSKHLDHIDMAHDYVGTPEEMEAAKKWWQKRMKGKGTAIVHDKGSGLHLHIQGLPIGDPGEDWFSENAAAADPRPAAPAVDPRKSLVDKVPQQAGNRSYR